jgi:hypothetical protein
MTSPHFATPSDAGSRDSYQTTQIPTSPPARRSITLIIAGIIILIFTLIGIWFVIRQVASPSDETLDKTLLTSLPTSSIPSSGQASFYHSPQLGVSFYQPSNTTVCETDNAILINQLDQSACDQFRQSPPSPADYQTTPSVTSGSQSVYQPNDQTAVITTSDYQIIITTNSSDPETLNTVISSLNSNPGPTPTSTLAPTSTPVSSATPTTKPQSSSPNPSATPTQTLNPTPTDTPPNLLLGDEYIEYW